MLFDCGAEFADCFPSHPPLASFDPPITWRMPCSLGAARHAPRKRGYLDEFAMPAHQVRPRSHWPSKRSIRRSPYVTMPLRSL
jgi:hypothetical protein